MSESLEQIAIDALEQAGFTGRWKYPAGTTALMAAADAAEIVADALAGYVVLSPPDVEKVREALGFWRAFCLDAGLTVNAAKVADLLSLLGAQATESPEGTQTGKEAR